MELAALLLSLKLATTSSVLLLVIGLPLTYHISQSRNSLWSVAEAFFTLPMLLPPTVLGFYLLLAFAPLGLAFSFTGLLIASLISGMAFAFPSYLSGFRGVKREYLDNARVLGDGKWMTFYRVALPLAKEGVLTGFLLSFAHAMGEFGVVLMIGGNIPGVSRTLSISLYDQVSALDTASANRTALVLLGFSLVTITFISVLNSLRRRREWN